MMSVKYLATSPLTTQVQEYGTSTFYEYKLPFNNLAVGVSVINGRYPQTGFDVDEKVEQVWYVESGEGTIQLANEEFVVKSGDMMLVKQGEKFWINGKNLKLVVSSNPPWTATQHKHLE